MIAVELFISTAVLKRESTSFESSVCASWKIKLFFKLTFLSFGNKTNVFFFEISSSRYGVNNIETERGSIYIEDLIYLDND